MQRTERDEGSAVKSAARNAIRTTGRPGASRWRLLVLGAVVAMFVAILNLYAEWSDDPNRGLIVGGGAETQMVSDGDGGVFIVGQAADYRIYAVHVNNYGIISWNEPLYVGGTTSRQRTPKLCRSGDEHVVIGCYASLSDTTPPAIAHIQKVNRQGSLLWGNEGRNFGRGWIDEIITTPQGEIIVGIWNGLVKRLTQEGDEVWAGESGWEFGQYDGFRVTRIDDEVMCFQASLDSAWVVWQKLGEDGRRLWEGNGRGIQITSRGITDLDIDSANTSYLGLNLSTGWGNGLVAALLRIDRDGHILDEGPLIISDDSLDLSRELQIASLDDGSVCLAWEHRSTTGLRRPYLELQRLSREAELEWQYPGITVNDDNSQKTAPQLIASGASVIASWIDGREVNEEMHCLYAQRFDSSGRPQWNRDGLLIARRRYPNRSLQADSYLSVTDGAGGAIYLFGGSLMHVSRNGRLDEVLHASTGFNPRSSTAFVTGIRFNSYPNPFNDICSIDITTPSPSRLECSIADITGRRVDALWHGRLEAENHTLIWNPRESVSGGIPAGKYFILLYDGVSTRSVETLYLK